MPAPRDGDGFVFDIGYLIAPDFYFGPANGFTPEQWGKLREPLPPPAIALVAGHLAPTAEVEGRIEELERHYARIVERMRRHSKSVSESQSYFWLRPFAWSGSGFALTFGWYDTLEEARTWIHGVVRLGEDATHSDMDQGWEMTATGEADHVLVVQGDGARVQSEVRFRRDLLNSKLEGALDRCERQVAELTKRVGRDYWTRRPTGGVP